jgi:hypothetical protein
MRAHSTSFATQHQICAVSNGCFRGRGSTYSSRSKHALGSMMVKDDVSDDWNGGDSVREEEVPFLEVVELLGVVSVEEDQQNIERHAEDLCSVSGLFAQSVHVLTQKESAIMNH